MTRAKKRSIISRILRRLPLPVLAIVVGLMVGTGVWVVVDTVQTRSVQQLFETELQTRLEQQARAPQDTVQQWAIKILIQAPGFS